MRIANVNTENSGAEIVGSFSAEEKNTGDVEESVSIWAMEAIAQTDKYLQLSRKLPLARY